MLCATMGLLQDDLMDMLKNKPTGTKVGIGYIDKEAKKLASKTIVLTEEVREVLLFLNEFYPETSPPLI